MNQQQSDSYPFYYLEKNKHNIELLYLHVTLIFSTFEAEEQTPSLSLVDCVPNSDVNNHFRVLTGLVHAPSTLTLGFRAGKNFMTSVQTTPHTLRYSPWISGSGILKGSLKKHFNFENLRENFAPSFLWGTKIKMSLIPETASLDFTSDIFTKFIASHPSILILGYKTDVSAHHLHQWDKN
ncbi:Protein of unknown function [Gryllus bimaculatus]|nr:Protein of unknown function [Gryllus bimaculatus]